LSSEQKILKSELSEQTTTLHLSIKNLEQEVSSQKMQRQQEQNEAKTQKEKLTEQQKKLVFLEDEVKQQVKVSQDYKREVDQLNNQQNKLKEQQHLEQKNYLLKGEHQQEIQDKLKERITILETRNKELANNLIAEQSNIKSYQKEVESLKSQTKLAQEGQQNILNRFNTSRDKQAKDNDQVRETIKYLRDENSEMITQHNEKKKQFIEQTHDLESKLTEYRLKFEYAQKQLTQNS